MKTYAFDVKLFASFTVQADCEADARAAVGELIDAFELPQAAIDGYNEAQFDVKVEECTLSQDGGIDLTAVDGEQV